MHMLLVLPRQEEVNSVEYTVSPMASVMANLIAYFVCKWMDTNPQDQHLKRTPRESPLPGGSLLVNSETHNLTLTV